ncbi:hypothetical protein EDB89DRAFT_551929 [Lactarius sanguifluus]|nr:hypothetical protein EDB89DRAFT_2079973 [Lactarius sanguifluus]KAH9174573.1 hypothetical protein EDB89DRAFT_551929 [Lactarius sanguifluus]
MSGYEKQNWPSQYSAPQGQGEYQQQPPYEPQQAWGQQPYAQQQGAYQPPQAYAPQQGGYPATSSYTAPQGFGAPPPGPYGSPQPQQSYGSPPPPHGQYGSPQVPSYGALPPSQNQYSSHQPPPPPQGQYGAPPPQGQYGSPPPQYGAPPQQQQWGGAPPQGPPGGPGGPEKRHSVSFTFTGTKKTILNSQVMDPHGKVPFNVVSDKKNTTVRASNGTTLAVVEWNHSAPIMHHGGKKLKCKEWIVWNNSKKVRVLTHAGKEYHWVTRNETVYLEPADRPGFTILIWRDPTDVVEIEAFQESLVVPGLLEAAIVAVVIMQSGHKLGDHGGGNNQMFINAIAGSIGANAAF